MRTIGSMRNANRRWNNSWLHYWGGKVAGILLVLLFAGSAVVGFFNVQAVHNQDQEIMRSRAVLAAISVVYADLTGAQAGVFNYVISGNPQYLEMYVVARQEVTRDLAELGSLTITSPSQETRVSRLRLLIPQEFGNLQAAVVLREEGHRDAALRFVASGQGTLIASMNRQIVDALDGTENQLLRQEIAKANSVRQATSTNILVVSLVDLVLLALIIALARQTMRLRERLAEERAQAKADTELQVLQETNRQMDEFISIASHEFRTPLTTLKANLQIATRRLHQLQQEDGSSDLLPLVERAAQSTYRLERLADDLLDVSRIKAGKLVMRPVWFDLARLLCECIEEQHQQHPQRIITVAAPTPTSCTVVADPDRIRQVVSNFLTNAIKFSQEDKPVAAGVSREGEMVRVCVRDEGPGLPRREQERIWERYHRAAGVERTSGSSVGLGLGLYISKMIIVQHGGEVGVESEVGRGSTFWFSLPAGAAPAAERMSTAAAV